MSIITHLNIHNCPDVPCDTILVIHYKDNEVSIIASNTTHKYVCPNASVSKNLHEELQYQLYNYLHQLRVLTNEE